MNQIKKIADYCRQRIDEYDDRVKLALGVMDRNRCDLMRADASLATEVEDCAREWAEENGYAVDFIEGINVEEIVLCGE